MFELQQALMTKPNVKSALGAGADKIINQHNPSETSSTGPGSTPHSPTFTHIWQLPYRDLNMAEGEGGVALGCLHAGVMPGCERVPCTSLSALSTHQQKSLLPWHCSVKVTRSHALGRRLVVLGVPRSAPAGFPSSASSRRSRASGWALSRCGQRAF